jgi:hypothetical protein
MCKGLGSIPALPKKKKRKKKKKISDTLALNLKELEKEQKVKPN